LDTLLSVEQAAERLGTSVRFVRRLVFQRRIAYVKLGRHVPIATRGLDVLHPGWAGLFRDWLGEWWGDHHQPAGVDQGAGRVATTTAGPAPVRGRLAAITLRDVRAWVAELSARGLAPATVQKAYQFLGKVLGAAVDAGMLVQSPCRRVPLPTVEREEMRFLTSAEVATLADAIHQRYRALASIPLT